VRSGFRSALRAHPQSWREVVQVKALYNHGQTASLIMYDWDLISQNPFPLMATQGWGAWIHCFGVELGSRVHEKVLREGKIRLHRIDAG
jgi:hypothetical protein